MQGIKPLFTTGRGFIFDVHNLWKTILDKKCTKGKMKIMRRIMIERNKRVLDRIMNGDYQIDIAKDEGVSPSMITKIKKRYMGEGLLVWQKKRSIVKNK